MHLLWLYGRLFNSVIIFLLNINCIEYIIGDNISLETEAGA